MNLLAIETATEACSVALATAAGIHARHVVAPRRHTELLFPMIDEVLAEAGLARGDVGAVAFGQGPGSFTGVRIAAAAAQGIARARDLPVVAVSSLRALAAGAARDRDEAQVVCAMDARRSEVYYAVWAFSAAAPCGRAVIADSVLAPAAVTLPGGREWLHAGNGWQVYAGEFAADVAPPAAPAHQFPEARDLVPIAREELAAGRVLGPGEALPAYLRGALEP